MGYSGRYHAASLVAVFIALAVGIMIGVGLADDVVSTASEEIEDTLRADLDESQQQAEDLQTDLDREREFSALAYPTLVAGELAGSEIAVVSFGPVPDDVIADVEAAVEPAGASVAAVAAVAEPIEDGAVADLLGSREAQREARVLRQLGIAAGRQMVGDGPVLQRLRDELFSSFSGDLGGVDRVVFVRNPDEEADVEQAARIEAFESGLIEGAARAAVAVAAVERTGTDPTTVEPFSRAGVPTVDHVDLVAGRLALVSVMLGTEGDFGTKEGADGLVPELFDPAAGEQGS